MKKIINGELKYVLYGALMVLAFALFFVLVKQISMASVLLSVCITLLLITLKLSRNTAIFSRNKN
jgi:hypothetical protein